MELTDGIGIGRMGSPADELWQLLEEIHVRGEAMKEEMQTMQMQTLPALPTDAATAALTSSSAAGKSATASTSASSSSKSLDKDMEHLKRKQMNAEQELNDVISPIISSPVISYQH